MGQPISQSIDSHPPHQPPIHPIPIPKGRRVHHGAPRPPGGHLPRLAQQRDGARQPGPRAGSPHGHLLLVIALVVGRRGRSGGPGGVPPLVPRARPGRLLHDGRRPRPPLAELPRVPRAPPRLPAAAGARELHGDGPPHPGGHALQRRHRRVLRGPLSGGASRRSVRVRGWVKEIKECVWGRHRAGDVGGPSVRPNCLDVRIDRTR